MYCDTAPKGLSFSELDCVYMTQGHITGEEDPPDVGADIVIISVHEERSTEAWSQLIRKCLKVRLA